LPFHAAAPAKAKLTNAASRQLGARFSLTTGTGVRKDPQTEPEATFDNNTHSRQVVSGVPYTFTIELPFRLPVEQISFANSDYETEVAPKELEITLDDGTKLHQTLEVKRPVKRKPVWQELPLGKEAKVIQVTVLSVHTMSEKVNWGGLGEIAVWTSANLEERFKIPGYEKSTANFNHHLATQDSTPVKVQLPARVKPGSHPCLLLTREEVAELRNTLKQSERGKQTLEAFLKVADGALTESVQFPDPKGPLGQLKDRGDAVARQHSRLSERAGTLGVAWALTGEPKFAQRAAEIVRGYAERYAAYPEHKGVNKSDTGKVMGQRLSEAMWLIPLIESFDYILDSGALTAADIKLIEEQLLRPAVTFLWRKEPAAETAERDRRTPDWRTATPVPAKGKSAANWLNYYNAATLMTGAVLGDSNMVDMAAANLRTLLIQGIGEDGMWGEGAIGYQMFAITAMIPGFETAAHQGIDLWGFDHARVKRLFDSPLRYAYPDGTAPGLNDSSRARFDNWTAMIYDYAWLRYGDPNYAGLVNAAPRQLQMSQGVYFPTRVYVPLPEVAATRFPSTVFGNLGYAILRSTNAYVLLDYGPHGGTHGHYDKLNLVLFGTGTEGKADELGGEPVFHRYEDPLHGQWTKQTVAHNTMTVDEQSQPACTGQLLLFEDTPTVKIMRAEAVAAPGALMDRTVVVTEDAILDLYHGRSGFSRTWDRTFRYQGKLLQTPPAKGAEPTLGQREGYEHLRVLVRKPAETSWEATWETRVGPLQLTVAGAVRQQMILADGPDQDQIALARQTGDQANIGAVLTMKAWGNPVLTASWQPVSNTNLVVFEVTQRDGTHTQVIISHAPAAETWQSPGWRSDARVLYVRNRGLVQTLLLAGGTFAKSIAPINDLEFRQPAPGNYLFEHRAGKVSVVSGWTAGKP
jgi:hypothetical protein